MKKISKIAIAFIVLFVFAEILVHIEFFTKNSVEPENVDEECIVTREDGTIIGEEYWHTFLEHVVRGEDASVEWRYEGTDETESTVLEYRDGLFYYKGAEALYLRPLMGYDGSPRKEVTMFVLTDSLELTCRDVLWSFRSSNT